jgi:hypothetical protein
VVGDNPPCRTPVFMLTTHSRQARATVMDLDRFELA